ncbi:MAG: diacylglycerol kinase family lipid kinase [Ruminococcaceae bacterium]|nr:diacylglycerol kinase family lipid kinase [Oscillospiraceae bacterium]
MKHVFIINPVAGKTDRTKEIRDQIHRLKITDPVEIHLTRSQGEAEHIARMAAQTGEQMRVYSCGGDGTANEVLTGIAGYNNCALGIIPIGSGNDFVRSLDSYTREDFLSVEDMVNGEEKAIDLLECQGKYSMNVFSVGFDCAVAKNVDRFKKLPHVSGSLAYKMSIVYCLFTKRKHPVKIYLDDKEFEGADYNRTTLLAVAANGKYYGGGIKAAPISILDDGFIDFVHAPTLSVLKFVSIVGKYTKGMHIDNPKLPFVTFNRCKKIRFEAGAPIDVNFDGEIFEMENPEITLLPKALRIVLPAKKSAVADKKEKETVKA